MLVPDRRLLIPRRRLLLAAPAIIAAPSLGWAGPRAPSLDYNFLFNAASLPSGAALTRSGNGWYFDSSGVLQVAGTNTDRPNYNSSGVLEGHLNEPAATNSVENNSNTGVVDGSAGTIPTGWTIGGALNGLTRTISHGTSNGIPYLGFRLNGTPSATSSYSPLFTGSVVIATTSNEVWALASYVSLAAGSTSNVTTTLSAQPRNAGGTPVGTESSTSFTPTGASLYSQRVNLSKTVNGTSPAFITGYIKFAYTSGQALDITLWIGAPQCVLSSSQSSPILTTAGAVTRNADTMTLTVGASKYNVDIIRTGQTAPTRVMAADGSGGSYVVPTSIQPLWQTRMSA